MASPIKGYAGNEDQIDIMNLGSLSTGRLRDTEASAEKIFKGIGRIKRQFIPFHFREQDGLLCIVHQAQKIHLLPYRIIDGNKMSILIVREITDMTGYLSFKALLFLMRYLLTPD